MFKWDTYKLFPATLSACEVATTVRATTFNIALLTRAALAASQASK
jgi:hypothetical protein